VSDVTAGVLARGAALRRDRDHRRRPVGDRAGPDRRRTGGDGAPLPVDHVPAKTGEMPP